MHGLYSGQMWTCFLPKHVVYKLDYLFDEYAFKMSLIVTCSHI